LLKSIIFSFASDVEFHLIPLNGAELELYSASYHGVG